MSMVASRKKSGPNLGRVLDKERGIYQSKERGIFTFDLKTNTYGKPPQSYVSNVRRKNARERLIVDYGDVFLFDALLDKYGLRQALQSLGYRNPDSLGALLLSSTSSVFLLPTQRQLKNSNDCLK